MSLPPGFIFAPTDEQIIGFYLKYLITNNQPFPPPVCFLIHHININGELPPWEVAAMLPDHKQRKDFYVYTKLKKLSPGRNQRTAKNGQGTWKGQNATRVMGLGVLGEKRMLSFLHGTNKNTSHWNMDEYKVFEIDGKPVVDDEDGCWVICHVKYNEKFGKRKSCFVQENSSY